MNKFSNFLNKDVHFSELINNCLDFFRTNKFLLFLILLYFTTRLVNLTLLPIFNDESIYLNWGWIETNGSLYTLSLADGKQPFLMWIFGFSERFFNDPLIAGRVISVISGFITFIALYAGTEKLISKKSANIAALIYIVSPLFILYDRFALMESSLAMIGVLSALLLISSLKNKNYLSSILCGLILGIGFFIKSTGSIFIASSFIIGGIYLMRSDSRIKTLTCLILIFIFSQIPLLELYSQDNFIKIIQMNARYSLTLPEIIKLPTQIWSTNLYSFLQISIIFITPFIFFFSLIGIYQILKNKNFELKMLITWLIIGISAFLIFTKNPITRYLLAFLPLYTVAFSYFIVQIKSKTRSRILLFISLIFPIILSTFLLLTPIFYFQQIKEMFHFNDEGYISEPSGYGIPETVEFIKNQKNNKITEVLVRSTSGNPEDALMVYLRKENRTSVNLLLSCYDTKRIFERGNNTFFVIADQNKYLYEKCISEIARFYKLDGTRYIGVYRLIDTKKTK